MNSRSRKMRRDRFAKQQELWTMRNRKKTTTTKKPSKSASEKLHQKNASSAKNLNMKLLFEWLAIIFSDPPQMLV